MLGIHLMKHKSFLKQLFSDCFLPVKDDLGNVPVAMQKSKLITASILGICRVYGECKRVNESNFDVIIDAVFEGLFRRESITVQTLAESWLQTSDQEFLFHYYQAKYRARESWDLSWLRTMAVECFKPAKTIVFPL